MKSKRTKKCRRLARIFTLIHILLCVGPFLYFLPMSFILATDGNKLFLSLQIVLALILSAIALISDAKTRGGLAKTIFWMLIIGITYCLSQVDNFIYIMALASIVDELIIVRLKDRYKLAYITNIEIDKRG